MAKLFNLLAIAASLTLISGPISNISHLDTNLPQANQNKEGAVKQEVQEALNQIDLNVDLNNIVTDLRLPYAGLHLSTLSWVSSNEEVVSIKTNYKDNGAVGDIIGKVTRNATDNEVTLTCTCTYVENKVSYTGTRVFNLKVIKASSIVVEELPLAFSDDFSTYKSGIDLSNYYKWQITKGEQGLVKIVDELPNFNEMAGTKAIQVTSSRAASEVYYETKLNVNDKNILGETNNKVTVFECDMLYKDETNGIALDLMSSGNKVVSISMNSTSYTFATSTGEFVSSVKPVEGVWQHFRVEMRLTGYFKFFLYNWSTNSYDELTTEYSPYIASAGVNSGAKGNIDALRLRLKSGVKNGNTYLTNLKVDTLPNMPAGAIENPNRSNGLGLITNYEPEIFGYKNNPSLFDNVPEFEVHNRFNNDQIYTADQYTVTHSSASDTSKDGYQVVTYTYAIKLTVTGEIKNVTQTFYLDDEANAPLIESFKVSYIKELYQDKVATGKGHVTISGDVYRDDVTINYVGVVAGSTAPTATQMKDPSSIANKVVYGTQVISGKSVEIDTADDLSVNAEYDFYAVAINTHGDSKIYKAPSVSTVVNISTAQDLYEMTTKIETKSSTFRLINDIDCGDYEWKFDDSIKLSFDGLIDGQGYTVSNLRISSPTAKVALFYEFKGTIKNINFDNAYISGLSDVAVIGGNCYGGNMSNVTFNNCKIDQEASVTGGEGYFATAFGRLRGSDSSSYTSTFENINIINTEIDAPKYIGLLTGGVGGSAQDVNMNCKNIFASGSVNTEGAAIGLIGRNRGTSNIENAVVFLDIIAAKKEVGALAGHNKEGGKLNVTNCVSDLKVKYMTQVTYFNNFIGSHDANTSSYRASNIYYLNEDYSDLADTISPTTTAIGYGKAISATATRTQKWWETQTFFKDIDIETNWAFNETTLMPYTVANNSSKEFTTADYQKYIDLLSSTDIMSNYYPLIKADGVYQHLTSSQQSEVSALKAKYDAALQAYNDMVAAIESGKDNIGNLGDDGYNN